MSQVDKFVKTLSGKCNIFFAFTPFNHLIVDALLEREEIVRRPSLIFNTSKHAYQNSNACVVNFCLENTGRLKGILGYWRIARILRKLNKNNMITAVYSPHPHNLLSNALMLRESGHEVCVYEDGIGNYWDSENTSFLKRQSSRKRLFAPLLGFSYRDYDGHFTGISERVYDRGYFLEPEKIFQANRFSRIEEVLLRVPGAESADPHEPLVLVLDQPIELIFDADMARELRNRLSEAVREIGLPVYIKSHPGRFESGEAPMDLGQVVTLVTSKAAAEHVAIELRPEYVVSFMSSALKNIKGIFPASTCISVGVEEFDALQGSHIEDLFKNFGLTTI